MTELSIPVSGLEAKSVGMVYRFGVMAPDTKVNGKMVKQTDLVNSGMSTAIFMKDHGSMTKLTARVLTPMQTDPRIQASGSMICSMGSASRPGKTDPNTRVNTKSGKSTVKVFTCGKTAHLIMGSGLIMILREKATISGMMADVLQAIGKIIICTDTGNMFGQMAEPTKASIMRIKNTALEFTSGRMVEYMKEIGRTENNMGEENSPNQIK